MAHDPRKEDYRRLSLRFALELEARGEALSTRALRDFGRRFARDRDSLPQTDADRAFGLVVLATRLIDYELPFADDDAAEKLVERGRSLLQEAVSLDERCFDAVRMLEASRSASIAEHYRWLCEHADEVRGLCLEQGNAAAEGLGEERAELARSLAARPWLRWLAAMAEEALICGHNHDARDAARRLLEEDPADVSDARFTLALALTKLEDADGFEELLAHYPTPPGRDAADAWVLLCRIAFAHKCCDFDRARKSLDELLRVYPGAAVSLICQTEVADGAFARLNVPAYGEDELTLALSEAVVLLQEGIDASGRGVLGSWIARQVAANHPEAAVAAMGLSFSEAGA